MKLSQFIPEIKIQPNTGDPKIGEVWLSIDSNDGNIQYECTILEDDENEYGIKIHIIGDEPKWDRLVYWTKESVLKSIKNKTFIKKSLKEIKIQPNEKIDTNEKLLFFVNKYKKQVVEKIVELYREDGNMFDDEDIENLIENPTKLRLSMNALTLSISAGDNITLSLNPVIEYGNYTPGIININGIRIYVY